MVPAYNEENRLPATLDGLGSYLDAWGIKGEPSGVGRYCRELIPRLVSQAPHHEFIVLRPSRLAHPEPIADVREIVVPRRRTHAGAVL